MSLSVARRRAVFATAAAAALGVSLIASQNLSGATSAPFQIKSPQNFSFLEHAKYAAGSPSVEGNEILSAAGQRALARNAPRRAAPAGGYSQAWAALQGLPTVAGTWAEVTNQKYDADDPNYRDPFYSNSSGGAGVVSGRVTGLAASGSYVYAGGADGGVFRSSNGGTNWTAISDSLPSLSTGDVKLAPDGALWLATGEANTGGTSYLGSGVYRLPNPTTGSFTSSNRVGGTELESTMINKLKFDDNGNVYAATSKGLWRHSSTTASGAWTNLLHVGSNPAGYYDDLFNDVEIQPGTQGRTIIANAAWRGYATYNGFYVSKDAGAHWAKVNPQGAVVAKNIGNAEFAYSADGTKLYTVVEDTGLYLKANQNGTSVLMGIFVSKNGNVEGPWTSVADYKKLAASGSALKTNSANRGYGPGVQAWYNNFIAVDPNNANHVFLGLEEVFETRDGGSKWSTIGPYWNFGFACWNILDAQNTCPDSTHPDQHSIAFANGRVYVGNDGGVYSRPKNSLAVNRNGNATDWQSHNANLRTLQYYSVGVGAVNGGYAVFGGLQDNGGSLLLPGSSTMVSPFGGDGGDSIVDPDDGCKILDEYVYLTLWVTTNCGATDGTTHAVKDVSVGDPNPQFTAPFEADASDKDNWYAGGQYIWNYDKGFQISSGADWMPLFNTGGSTTGMSANNGIVYAGWCGSCVADGFGRGIATNYGGTWHNLTLPAAFPNRYLSGVQIDPNDADGSTAYAVFSGFGRRRFVEGPAAGYGHLWKTTDGGVTWADASGNLPDVPADDLVITAGGKLVLGTDLGVVISSDGGAHWSKLGGNHPSTTVMDLHEGPDGKLYSATHGRGIWSIANPA
jgi:hypothetical protein